MKQKNKLIQYTLGLLLMSAVGKVGAQEVFFGEDPGVDDSTVLASTPNADAARADFLARLGAAVTGTEDFENFTAGQFAPLPIDFTLLTATLNGQGFIRAVAPGATDGDGRYPTSGDQFWITDLNYTIQFSEPVQGFGFYGIDMGDFAGQLTISYDTGVVQDVDIPHTINGPTGSVLYFGLVSDEPFTAISFVNSDPGDVFGFDDFTVAAFQPPRPRPPAVPVPAQSPWGLGVLVTLLLLVGGMTVRRSW